MHVILIENGERGYCAQLQSVDEQRLPEGNVTVRVKWSTVNYKDGLALTGKAPVVRKFPMVPGIDFAGVVEVSEDPRYRPGDEVILNGWGVGETHWGGFAEKARVPGDWLLPRPAPLTLRQCMGIGTAGYTAMLCVMALERHRITPDSGPILVTGAAGGVGSVAITLLAKLGYEVVAVSGRPNMNSYLTALGASTVLPRSEFASPGKPLAKQCWAGAVDVVGSQTLANVCASMKYGGVVAACGMAGGLDLPATVAPFILRGVTLAGIDSVMCPRDTRLAAWERLARDWDVGKFEQMTEEITLEDTIGAAQQAIAGLIRGRLIVRVSG